MCLAASAGGHLSQALKLEPAWGTYDCFFVTTSDAAAAQLEGKYKTQVEVVLETNRQQPLRVARMLLQCIGIIARRRPDVVISTGAAPGCILCFLGKMTGARVAWVDSIANVERLSLSGRLVRPIADVFLTQWEDLADAGRGVEYAGELG